MKDAEDRIGLAEALAIIARGRDPVPPEMLDVARLRGRMGMTQKEFAARFGFPVATLRHWERGDRKPRGPALVLLTVIARQPRAVLQALSRCGFSR